MFKVVNKQILANDVKRLDVLAPDVARRVQPGQFVMVIAREEEEWIPLSVAEADERRGTIALVFQEVGPATRQLGAFPINDSIHAIIGPLGQPAVIGKSGVVVCVTTGIGTARILPVCRALKAAGNKVIGVIGAKTKREVLLEAQLRLSCHKILITTNDGSYDRKGLATDVVKQLLDQEKVNLVYAVGALDMLESVVKLAAAKKIPTRVQLNSMMYCGTGLCSSCRIKVKGRIVLSCQEGPEFDGQEVDFADLRARMKGHASAAEPARKASGKSFSQINAVTTT